MSPSITPPCSGGVQAYADKLEQRVRRHLRPCTGSWRVDETYIKVKGVWTYLYRAVDSLGQTIDFLLSARRNADAAKRFFRKALAQPNTVNPRTITVDIGDVSALVRVGSALGLAREAAVNWSVDWLLDQQNPEGHFGLIPVELQMLKTGSLSIRTELKVAAILALAEYVTPGWLWSNLGDECDQGGHRNDSRSLESVSNRFDAVQPA